MHWALHPADWRAAPLPDVMGTAVKRRAALSSARPAAMRKRTVLVPLITCSTRDSFV